MINSTPMFADIPNNVNTITWQEIRAPNTFDLNTRLEPLWRESISFVILSTCFLNGDGYELDCLPHSRLWNRLFGKGLEPSVKVAHPFDLGYPSRIFNDMLNFNVTADFGRKDCRYFIKYIIEYIVYAINLNIPSHLRYKGRCLNSARKLNIHLGNCNIFSVGRKVILSTYLPYRCYMKEHITHAKPTDTYGCIFM